MAIGVHAVNKELDVHAMNKVALAGDGESHA
jgi:hypothetical protein